MPLNPFRLLLLTLVLASGVRPAAALDMSVAAIGGDVSRRLLSDGTGVVVGVVDSGLDTAHPALAGVDALGQPRVVAQANFVTSEPTNTGDDAFGHGTGVASVIAGADPTHQGLAPGARLINARVLDSGLGFDADTQVLNGVGFALDSGADVLNLSLNYGTTSSGGSTPLDLMLDWAIGELGVSVALTAGNTSPGRERVRGPGGAYNGLTVGHTDAGFGQVHPDSATAFTQNNRMKPDLVAPGAAIDVASVDWEAGDDFVAQTGSSFAAPHVAGLIAQQIGAGRQRGLSTDPRVIKATQLNAASKAVLDKSGDAWSASAITQPLDTDAGAGQVDGAALATQYLAGEQGPGAVNATGWDLAPVTAGEFVDYQIGDNLQPGSRITATVAWLRNVARVDGGQLGVVDAGDSFRSEALDNLDLHLLADGQLVARSISFFDNVEHLWFTAEAGVDYTVRVVGTSIVGSSTSESFAVAWSAVAVPEPSALLLLLVVLGVTMRLASRCRAA